MKIEIGEHILIHFISTILTFSEDELKVDNYVGLSKALSKVQYFMKEAYWSGNNTLEEIAQEVFEVLLFLSNSVRHML